MAVKTTDDLRQRIRATVRAYPNELSELRLLLDDFEELARELEDARDRLQVLELELAELRRQLAGGPP